jgi:AcrR family transcriptional regulator
MPASTLIDGLIDGSQTLDGSSSDARLVDAALRCIARWGVAKTTLDDVAREAACSRATIYRAFPGGKESLVAAVVATELGRFRQRLVDRLEGAETLEDLLVAGVNEAYRSMRDHAALQFVLAHEPELVLPGLTFHRLEFVLAAATSLAAPFLAPHVGDEAARPVSEWLARIVLSYTLCPSDGYDLADEDATRRLVRSFVLPGIDRLVPTRS